MSTKYQIRSNDKKLNLTKSKRMVGLKLDTSKRVRESVKKQVRKTFHEHIGGFKVVQLEEDKNADESLDTLREEDVVEIGTHVFIADGSDRPLVPNGEIMIWFEEGLNHEEKSIVLKEFALELIESRSEIEWLVKVTRLSPNPIKCAQFLQDSSLVQSAEPDIDTYLDEYDYKRPKDGLFSHQWHLNNTGIISDANYRIKRGADSKVVEAWKKLNSLGSQDITIAIVDNGFDLSHSDLKNKVVNPYDFWKQSTNISKGNPDYTHGTPCASVALARINGTGIVGSAPNARFMPLSGTTYSDRGTEQIFEYAVQFGADIISCSWGTTNPTLIPGRRKIAAISKAAQNGRKGLGCIVLFAVGNDNLDYISYYADHPYVIAVSASTSKDTIAAYSNRGPNVTLCAPSNGDWPIIAARAWWDEGTTVRGEGEYRWWADGRSRGNKYKHFGGTSSATPLVAGICALILSANPKLRAGEVKEILIKTADKIGNPNDYNSTGHSPKYGYGRVNAHKAVSEAFSRLKPDHGTPIKPDKPGQPDIDIIPKPPVTIPKVVGNGRGIFRFDVKREKSNGFGVQVGVFAKYANVLLHAESYGSAFGEPVIVAITSLNGQTVYKLLIGDAPSRAEANLIHKKLRDAGVAGFVRSIQSLA